MYSLTLQMGFINGDSEFSEVELESARSSLIFEIIEEEKTIGDVAYQSMLSYFREVGHDYNKYGIHHIHIKKN